MFIIIFQIFSASNVQSKLLSSDMNFIENQKVYPRNRQIYLIYSNVSVRQNICCFEAPPELSVTTRAILDLECP